MREDGVGIPVRSVLGVPVHAATMTQVLEKCDEAIRSRRQLTISVVNAAKMVKMRRQRLLYDSVVGGDLVLADGMAVVWASRILGQPLPERVNGTDLFEKLLAVGDKRGYSVFLLGAEQDVLNEMCRRIEGKHPNLRIVGKHHGYFEANQAECVVECIRCARPDLLFVGMTSPKKEVFMARWGATMDVPVCHGVGGSFDVLAGKVRRAPLMWQRAGLEWLFRTLQEPRRMWKRYLTTNSLFIWMVMSEWLRGLRGRSAGRVCE